jgi:hypothetical protein
VLALLLTRRLEIYEEIEAAISVLSDMDANDVKAVFMLE